MLQYLRIRDVAVVEKAQLEFGPGFTAITGETGAGKSVLLGALALLAGERADKGRIRHGSEDLEVEAVVHLEHPDRINQYLAEISLPICEDGALLIQRSVSRTRAARILVNGQLTTQANLQALGELWLDVHGPGEPQTLFKERRQLELLDIFARNGAQLRAYQEVYSKWRNLLRQMDALRHGERMAPEEVEFVQAQIDSIDRAAVSEEGVASLEREFTRVESAQDLIEGTSTLAELLNGDDGVSEKLTEAAHTARQMARLDPALQALADRIESALIELADIAAEYEDAGRACEFEEEEVQAVRERMELWLQLKRKYGPSVAQVLQKREALFHRLSSQGDVEGRLIQLEGEASKLEQHLHDLAEKLRQKRLSASAELGKQVTTLLARLGFKHASLRIEVIRQESLSDIGNSTCSFLFAPNPGQEPQPLNKIASSGELARVMLAIKTVLAAEDETPVLVFDEVDANVGGEVAVEVGRELAGLGKRHQVFCVTHLPQVASQAPSHFVVEKSQTEDSTTVSIHPLHGDRAARVGELARMLGGRSSAAAIEHAETLLATCAPVRA